MDRDIAPAGQGWTRHLMDGGGMNLNHHPVCAASDAAHFLLTGVATPSWPGGAMVQKNYLSA